MDTSVDIKLPDNRNSASGFSKVIGSELLHGSSNDIYLHCQMNFFSNVVKTWAPKFVGLEIPDVNTSNEFAILGTPATRPTDGSHWSMPDHVFGESTVAGIRATGSDGTS